MSLITRSHKVNIIDRFIDDVADTANNNVHYYAGMGGVVSFADDNTPPTETDNFDNSFYKIHRELVLAKKINSADINKVVLRYNWTSGVKYAMYDDRDNASVNYLANNNGFYVYSSTGSVYKCLNNGKGPGTDGVASTIEPSGTSNVAFTTDDGYKWKYMYSIDANSALANFITDDFIPVEQNSNVYTTAIDGALETILLQSNGVNYSAYANGTITSSTNTTVFVVNFNATNPATGDDNSFVGSSILLEGETSNTTVATITAYSSSTKTITIDTSVSDIANVQTFQISPKVTITGDGSGAVAFAEMNFTANTIQRIKMYAPGANYTYANITLSCNTNFRVLDATARPVISPPGGHGSNTAIELGCERYELYKEFDGAETSTLPVGMSIRTLSLLKDVAIRGIPGDKYTSAKAVQTTSFEISNLVSTSVTYQQGDLVYTATGNAVVAFANSTNMLLSNVAGSFVFNQTLNPTSLGGSSASDSPDNKYRISSDVTNPDIEFGSGQVLYYQNILPSTRQSTQKETFRLIVKV